MEFKKLVYFVFNNATTNNFYIKVIFRKFYSNFSKY